MVSNTSPQNTYEYIGKKGQITVEKHDKHHAGDKG